VRHVSDFHRDVQEVFVLFSLTLEARRSEFAHFGGYGLVSPGHSQELRAVPSKLYQFS